MTERRNQYGGWCRKCRKPVEAGEGFLLKVDGKWKVEHAAGECVLFQATINRLPKAPKPNQYGGKCADCGKYVPANTGRITKTAAGWKAAHLDSAGCEAATAAPAPKAPRQWNVPTGYYAVASRKGNDLDFFYVKQPKKGKWVGWTFASEVIGGRVAPSKLDRATQTAALEAIEAAGADVAGRLYFEKIGTCCVCNKRLTDDESRTRGIGPDCWQDRQDAATKVAA